VSPINYWLLVFQVAARNAVPLVGILVDGWSAANVVVLYFLDTLLSVGVIVGGLAKALSPASETVARPVRMELTYVAAALLACAIFAVPLGVPVGIVLAISDFSFTGAFHDRSLRIGALVQCAIALWSYVGLRRALASHSPSELRLKQRFGIILVRWAAVLGACYLGAQAADVVQTLAHFDFSFEMNRALPLLLVVTYVAVSIVAEIMPSRLLRGTPADEPERVK
jgi:hypothetical protein